MTTIVRKLGIGLATIAVVGITATIVSIELPVSSEASPAAVQPVPARLVPKPRPTARVATPEPAYVVKRILDIPGPMRHGDFHWDEAGVPAGPMIVTVDLAAQTLSVFRGGYEIGTAVILYGADEKPTPLGVFAITQKDAKHVSSIYNAPMPYMLRLTNDGVSIHGSEVADGYMTHGCVGVPTAFAKKLFGAVKLGDRVIVTRGEMLDLGGKITAA